MLLHSLHFTSTLRLLLLCSLFILPSQCLKRPPLKITRREWLSSTGVATLLPALLPSVAADDAPPPPATSRAIFSGGNTRFFQPSWEKVKYMGVRGTTAGRMYKMDEKTGEEVSVQAVAVDYASDKVNYKRLLGVYWRAIDPTRSPENGQFTDRTPEYGAIIWTASPEQAEMATESARRLEKSGLWKGKPVLTEARSEKGWTFEPASESEQRWAANNVAAYETGLKKTNRAQFFEDAYKPIKTTACEGSVCGYVYFPCSDENGCTAVLTGKW
jgi:peptide methionine sulfoxide reductase MsrA